MTESNQRVNLLGFTRQDLQAFFAAMGEKAFRASQLLQWIHQYGVADFDAMTNLSKTLRGRLQEMAVIQAPELVTQQLAQDGTHKWLLSLDSGNCIETVFIPEQDRGTLCISSQVGCALACPFCSTAQQGFNRNLTVAEIMAQIWLAKKTLGDFGAGQRRITNVVFMGMGEPLLNFDHLVKAIDLLQDDFAYGLSKRRITISTAGVVPALHRLSEISDVSLAVSLHAPEDRLRDELVPLNRKYPIAQLMAACRQYVQGQGKRKVTFEYVMLEGINDGIAHAHQLVALLQGIPAKVNLIPFNPFPATRFRCSGQGVIDKFRDILWAAGLTTVTRKTRGEDIDAACGQLAGKVLDRSRRKQRLAAVSGE